MTKSSYSARQQTLMRRLIRLHTKPIYSALQAQMKEAAALIRAAGVVKDISTELPPIVPGMGQTIINLTTDAAKLAKKNYMLVKRFGPATDFINKVISYLRTNILTRVVAQISNTTRNIINNIVSKAITEGWGVEKTAKYLETAPITKVRARMIIRTESVRATNFTQWMAADDEVYQMEKTWIAVEDKRTRPTHSHVGVDGQTQDLQTPFSNGLLYPGDPNGPAEEVINCRCCMSFRVKRDLGDRPIKKNSTALV